MLFRTCVLVGLGLAILACPASAEDELVAALAAIKNVKREGKGNDDAGPAWKTLVGKGSQGLLPALEAFDDDNPTAANWLRTAVQAIAAGETSVGHKLPTAQIEAFVTNTRKAAAARSLAFELLAGQDPNARPRLLPGFVNDKSADLRREAIEFELAKLEMGPPAGLAAGLAKLFEYTRDKDQVELLAKKRESQGQKVSVSEHFAFITRGSIVGPFPSKMGAGFQTVYPPENAANATENYPLKDGATLKWKEAATDDKYGTFDLTKILDKHKDSVAYALAEIVSPVETPCDIRVASPNAIQLFLNGKKLCQREEYHHGSPLDANMGKGILKKGINIIVLKICQNDQKEPWAQSWQFQMRVCDATGGPIAGLLQRAGTEQIKLGFIREAAEVKPPEEAKK